MIKCSNCAVEATFTYAVTAGLKLHYCTQHLPKFLRGRGESSLLRTLTKDELAATPAPKKRSTKKVTEEPVVEESAVEPAEETVEETDGIN